MVIWFFLFLSLYFYLCISLSHFSAALCLILCMYTWTHTVSATLRLGSESAWVFLQSCSLRNLYTNIRSLFLSSFLSVCPSVCLPDKSSWVMWGGNRPRHTGQDRTGQDIVLKGKVSDWMQSLHFNILPLAHLSYLGNFQCHTRKSQSKCLLRMESFIPKSDTWLRVQHMTSL